MGGLLNTFSGQVPTAAPRGTLLQLADLGHLQKNIIK